MDRTRHAQIPILSRSRMSGEPEVRVGTQNAILFRQKIERQVAGWPALIGDN